MNPKETFFKTGDLAFYKNYDGEIEAHLVLSKAILPSNFSPGFNMLNLQTLKKKLCIVVRSLSESSYSKEMDYTFVWMNIETYLKYKKRNVKNV